MILIIGGTGLIGSKLLERLSRPAHGARWDVRVLTRTDDAAAQVRAAGLQAAAGDLSQPQTLPEAFSGVQRLFLLTPFSQQ